MKLIDADKLLEWLKDKEQYYGTPGVADKMYCEGREDAYRYTMHAIHAGTFDPTPVQPDTLSKLYKCPNCERVNIAEAWNYATAAKYGAMEITRIDEIGCMDASFVCPSCETEEDYGRLEVIK
ncbi:hypothetical protein [Paenibacillus jilunlii]|uniref:Uncharacterized protein n=1 Tax=Paenibacillus jilunlii TaxID=682956 RepID=A0A1G9ZZV3_9BACL|nr:hypothetical protein [Paenibacillus jilunlii]KWX79934.1 hypothetical protein AML91_01835 [Paenibacillus jilunlii]SDN27009.1 hypothetical protein SAMN05216191_13422 [Paenibacillus jilunlii]